MGTILDPSDIKRFEVTEVFSDPNATVDIVLVHGLNGHPRDTWTAPPSKKSKHSVYWPTDLLPVSLKSAKARILTYGYNADVYAFNASATSDRMHQHAQTLLANLSAERKLEERSDVPIIWVAHSLGGILVKRALNLSYSLTATDEKRSIFVATYGIIFLGTPHTGADAAKWGHTLQAIGDALIPKKFMDSEPHLLRTLKANNETLQNINLQFLDICQNFQMNMVHEAVKTDLKGTRMFIVDQESASPLLPNVTYYGIEATHSGMCKFETKNSPGYTNVSGTLKSWIELSPRVIKGRVEFEKEAKIRKLHDQANQIIAGISSEIPRAPEANQVVEPVRMGSNEGTSYSAHKNQGLIEASPRPGVVFEVEEMDEEMSMVHSIVSIEPDKEVIPLVVTPPGFRPNSLFVGRETQLNALHKTLFDKKRRAEGTSACLLQSLPGGGKTHLARQYMYSHIDDFPGGVFWVNAKSQQQLEAGFWDIYRRTVINGKDGRFTPGGTVDELSGLRCHDEFIDIVTEWFRQTRQWLLVLDGIHFHNVEAIKRFLPDSVDSSLIYTSTERSVSGDFHFMNPQVITVPPLSAVEAQQLFLQELDKKNATKDELKHSMELVQMMGFNPLVIHTVAQRLKRTRETLAKFARSYSSEPILRGLDAYKAVIKDLQDCGANEALNLINILCFFSQHIPVEMISYGLDSLDVEVKAVEPDTGASLDNTFLILNSFALVDRNEPEDIASSQSSQSSKSLLADNIDMLRIHSVVQDFFVDSLRANGSLPYFLRQAIKLFCGSYNHADRRIKKRGTQGLVEDYRRYHVHGGRLLEHMTRSEKFRRFDAETKIEFLKTLDSIKGEIEGRTPSSSQQIARGKPEAFEMSVFDRTSSSSDTGPDTPGHSDRRSTGLSTNHAFFDEAKEQFQSPTSITHETSLITPSEFPPLPHEDYGYDSDDDYDMSENATIRGKDSGNLGPWQTVGPRGRTPRRRQQPAKILWHRTIKAMKSYSDTEGAFRSVPTDPRVRNLAAHGTIRLQSRGRNERSIAEDSLGLIKAKSPPPIRGGGIIKDRRNSSTRRGSEARQIMSYASALCGHPSRPDSSRSHHVGSPQGAPTTGLSPTTHVYLASEGQKPSDGGRPVRPPISAAISSLQGIPTLRTTRHQNRSDDNNPGPSNPPYPLSETFPRAGRNSEQNSEFDPPVYGRNTNPLPFERIAPSSYHETRKRASPHDAQDYPSWTSYHYPETTSSSPGPSFSSQNSPYLPNYSSPNMENTAFRHYPRDTQKYNHHESGYTSQPMSRDPSGQSANTNLNANPHHFIRRSSMTETEPAPELRRFSPPIPQQQQQQRRIPPTSYYDQRAELRREGPMRKSPRMEFASVASGVAMNRPTSESASFRHTSPPPDRMVVQRSNPINLSDTSFNPTASSFYPRKPSSVHGYNSDSSNIAFSNVGSQFAGFGTSTQFAQQSHSNQGMPVFASNVQAPEMGRVGSGGIRTGGGGFIQFGDYPIFPEAEGDSMMNDVFPRIENEREFWGGRGANEREWGVSSMYEDSDVSRARQRIGYDSAGIEARSLNYGRDRSLSNPERMASGDGLGLGFPVGVRETPMERNRRLRRT